MVDKTMKKYSLVDYKGKYTIIMDKGLEDNSFDFIVGEITHDEAIAQAGERIEACNYYGIPAIITKDKELNEIYDRLYENN